MLKIGVRPGKHTTLHMPRFESYLKNMKLFLIPTKNKSAFEKSYGQRPRGCRMERLIQNNPPGQFCINKTTKVSQNPLLIGWVQMEAVTEEAGETSTEVIKLSNQGTTGAGH
jgi:hypothetical protein